MYIHIISRSIFKNRFFYLNLIDKSTINKDKIDFIIDKQNSKANSDYCNGNYSSLYFIESIFTFNNKN
jgi:hypothetical protein